MDIDPRVITWLRKKKKLEKRGITVAKTLKCFKKEIVVACDKCLKI